MTDFSKQLFSIMDIIHCTFRSFWIRFFFANIRSLIQFFKSLIDFRIVYFFSYCIETLF